MASRAGKTGTDAILCRLGRGRTRPRFRNRAPEPGLRLADLERCSARLIVTDGNGPNRTGMGQPVWHVSGVWHALNAGCPHRGHAGGGIRLTRGPTTEVGALLPVPKDYIYDLKKGSFWSIKMTQWYVQSKINETVIETQKLDMFMNQVR